MMKVPARQIMVLGRGVQPEEKMRGRPTVPAERATPSTEPVGFDNEVVPPFEHLPVQPCRFQSLVSGHR